MEDGYFRPRLGTLLYTLWHGHPPFPELEEHRQDDLIAERYRKGQYPIETSHATGIDAVIGKCWTSRYDRASEILDDMDRLSTRGTKTC